MRALIVMLLALTLGGPVAAKEQCVILLHGLVRSSGSMDKLDAHLQESGYLTVNRGYPSRDYSIEKLAPRAVEPALLECRLQGATQIHFVTHSLGGILVRQYLADKKIAELGRVVMLGPPNNGSEAVDRLRDSPVFDWIHGPAGKQLGTGKDSTPRRLGPVNFELGVVAGSNTFNPVLSTLLPGPDDGKVSVKSARVPGMADFIVVPVSHPFLMRDKHVMELVVYFLKHGFFSKP